MDIVFIDKKSENNEKTILHVDAQGLGACTISQLLDATPKFRNDSNFQDGTVTTVGEIQTWAKEHSEDYDAYIFDGNEEYKLEEYTGEKTSETEEDTTAPDDTKVKS